MITVGTTALVWYRQGWILGQTVKPGYAGLWMTPGGRVEEYETTKQGIERELVEELGHDIECHYEHKIEIVNRGYNRHWIFFVYSGELDDKLVISAKSDFVHPTVFTEEESRQAYRNNKLTPVTREVIRVRYNLHGE